MSPPIPRTNPHTGRTFKAVPTPPSVEPLVVRPRDAWRMLGCGNTHGYSLLAAGELETYREGGARKITVESIRRYIARRLAADPIAAPRRRGRPGLGLFLITLDERLKRDGDHVLATVGVDHRRRRHAGAQALADVRAHVHEANRDFEIFRFLRAARGRLGDRLTRPRLGGLGEGDVDARRSDRQRTRARATAVG